MWCDKVKELIYSVFSILCPVINASASLPLFKFGLCVVAYPVSLNS